MKLNFLIKTSLIVLLVTSLVSCSKEDNIPKNLLNVKIEFKTFLADKNLDIIAVGHSSAIKAEYIWSVDGKTYVSDSEDGKGLHWGPRVGDTEFCLTVKTDDYPEGIKVCKTFTRTQKEVDDNNSTISSLVN